MTTTTEDPQSAIEMGLPVPRGQRQDARPPRWEGGRAAGDDQILTDEHI